MPTHMPDQPPNDSFYGGHRMEHPIRSTIRYPRPTNDVPQDMIFTVIKHRTPLGPRDTAYDLINKED